MTMFGSWEVSKKLPLRWILERCPVKSRWPQGWKPWSPKSGSGEWLFIFIAMTWIIWITWISCISKGAKHLILNPSAEDTTSYLNAWANGGPTPQGCTSGGCSSGFQGARPYGGLSQSPNFDVHVQTICKSCAGQAKIVMPGCPYGFFCCRGEVIGDHYSQPLVIPPCPVVLNSLATIVIVFFGWKTTLFGDTGSAISYLTAFIWSCSSSDCIFRQRRFAYHELIEAQKKWWLMIDVLKEK